MKKRLMLLLACLFVGIGLVTAQTSKVTGVVTSEEDGEPVVGASVLVVGSSLGTITDIDGKFSISNVPSSFRTLRVSYVGMKPLDMAIKAGIMKIVLQSDAKALDEVVVTAMGIKRSEKALGYSATSVSSDKITKTRTSDVMSGLSGKIAGVQISSSSSDPGSSNSVVIRGFSSITGSNQPLYIVDGMPMNNESAGAKDDELNKSYDFGTGANAVNPDDVESMTVLKGAAATALYGSRAANGVIMITTKSGKKQGKGLGIEYNGGVQGETVLRYPELQNEFGMGWSGTHSELENGSWGPRFDGANRIWGNVYENSQKVKPYVAMKDNIKDFFDTGFRYSNSLSFNNANEKSNYYVSFSQVSSDGMLPSNADTYDKYTFSARGGHKVGNLSLSSSVNYASQRNKFATTGQGLSMINSLYQTPRDISIIGQKDLNDPFNSPGYYYTPYGVTNPYYILDTYQNNYKSEKIYGKFQADYDFLKYFKATYRIGLDATNSEQHYGEPNLSTLFAGTPNDGAGNFDGHNGTTSKQMLRRREINQDLLLSFSMPVEDFNINALVGGNFNERKYSSLESSVTGLDIPMWYHLSNSASTPVVIEESERRRTNAVFAQIDLGWKSMVYLTATARNDWSSTMPKGNRGFFYPGVTGSFVFSELFNEDVKSWFSFGKIRAAYGKTGNDADPYMTSIVFRQSVANKDGWGEVSFPLNGVNAFTKDNTLGNEVLKPEMTTEFEFGGNVAFFNGRVSLDASYYNRNSDNQIISMNMDAASGYTFRNINLGKIRNQGVELLVSLRPIETKDFSWDVSWNFTKNKSEVISLPEEMGGIAKIYGLSGGSTMYAIVGQPLGVFMAEVAETDGKGNIVVNPGTGMPTAASDQAIVGDMNYKYQMGVSTSLRYKSLTLSADLDIRQGGKMYSRTKAINNFTGNAIETAYNDRNNFIVPNSVNKVMGADGSISYVENVTPISYTKIGDFWDAGGVEMGSGELIDKSYIKLRSIVFGWDLPKRWLGKTPIEGMTLSVYGSNLFVWTPSGNTFIDPEMTSFGNDLKGQYGEWTANPSSRKFGFNLMVKF